jgi:large subunit ribosomal protein L16
MNKKQPNNLKFPKSHKGGRLNPGIKLDKLNQGNYGLVANEPGIILSAHILSVELAIKRVIKKEGVVYLRVFPHTPVTKKPSEVRMGKGKGSVNHYVAKVQKGSIIMEIKTNVFTKALTALAVGKSKLPLSTSIIQRSPVVSIA